MNRLIMYYIILFAVLISAGALLNALLQGKECYISVMIIAGSGVALLLTDKYYDK